MSDRANAEVQRGWELTEQAILEAKVLAEEDGADLVLIFVPSSWEHVNWPYIEGAVDDLDVDQLDGVEMRHSEFGRHNGIGYINLLPGIRSDALRGEMLYFPNDGHRNGEGHVLAAELIYLELIADRASSDVE